MQATLLALLAGGGHALRVFSAARPALPRCGAPPVLVVRAREETIQQTIAGNEVVIYSKTWCPYCAQTKKLFDELQQPYTAIELDEREDGDELQAALLAMTQQRTVPSVFVAGKHLGGNDDTQSAARSGKLAALLEAPAAAEAFDGCVVPAGAGGSAEPAGFDPVAMVFELLFAPGKERKIVWGVLQQPVDQASVPSEQERAARRASAAEQLVNIDGEERDRRRTAGLAFSALTGALAVLLLAAHAPAAARLGVGPPLFLSIGFLASAQAGLWNIGQGGVWDVDGSGIQKIEDPAVAAALRAKVNAFNLKCGAAAVAATLLFAALPELF